MRILAFVKYGTLSASTRQRFMQYEPYLRAAGMEIEYSPLLDNSYLQGLVDGRAPGRLAVVRAYLGRLGKLLGRKDCDLLWVHTEFFPYLPGWAESLAALLHRKPLVLDFDDAIFHNYDAHPRPLVRRALGDKLKPLLRRAAACCCGNSYIHDYVSRYCPKSIVLPTVVNTDEYRPRAAAAPARERPVIGWIGSPSTWRYMHLVLPLLKELDDTHGIKVRVVGAGAQAATDGFPGLEFIDWKEETEIREVQEMDVGIMPLPDELWARGKSGYKLIQYMACGLPVVASPVGVNSQIVEEGSNGFLARGPDEWKTALSRLIADPQLRARMGAAGRKRAEEEYSVQAHAPRLVELLASLAPVAKGRA
jgi:hypothetical protein